MNIGKVDVLLGFQWSDEGKGKVVDVLTPRYDVVARSQGGLNTGHTLESEGQKYVLRSTPSGIFQGGKTNTTGNEVVSAPGLLMGEAKDFEKSGHPLKERLHTLKKAHLIMSTHRIFDRAYEVAKGKNKAGTTGKGIGPTHTNKVSRNGLCVGDIFCDFEQKYAAHKDCHMKILAALSWTDFEGLEETERFWMEGITYTKEFKFVDSEDETNRFLRESKYILCEGVQGTTLDVDPGSYPSVTSSNTICVSACTGPSIGPNKVGNVYGIMKAYCTCVGSGLLPAKLFDETGRTIRDLGREYGAVTGRERRCGWIDLVQLRYSVVVNDMTELIMMKSDVLDSLETIKVCIAYELPDGTETKDFPYEIDNVRPIYKDFRGWKKDMAKCKSQDELPEKFCKYAAFFENCLETRTGIISVGPDREQAIVL